MDLRDLIPEEDVVFFGLLREIITADGKYSDAEREHITKLTKEMGKSRVEKAMAEAGKRFPSRAALKDAAKAVTRPEARLAIIGYLERVAAADEVTPEEDKPLKWLASWWGVAR
jgi:uncharacterized tellurite resistance protein B-like protein